LRQELERPNQPIEYAYFPEEGMASVVAVGDDDTSVEIGIIGCEGMTGVTIVTGNDRSPNATFIQLPGKAQRIAASDLRRAIRESPSLHFVLLKYVQAFMMQTAHTAMANGTAPIETRLARWLLMAHDRSVSDDLLLTHEFLSLMLSVRRAGVTVAVNGLANRGLISTGRGQIHHSRSRGYPSRRRNILRHARERTAPSDARRTLVLGARRSRKIHRARVLSLQRLRPCRVSVRLVSHSLRVDIAA
jgi:CRP-like cAMP-binding protein